jgi:hypothetical protein
VNSATSESLRITQSTSEIAATSASRAMFTQRSIESRATNFACSHWRRTLSCSAGKMFARNSTSQSCDACESFGSNCSKTLRSVSSVSREFMLSW